MMVMVIMFLQMGYAGTTKGRDHLNHFGAGGSVFGRPNLDADIVHDTVDGSEIRRSPVDIR